MGNYYGANAHWFHREIQIQIRYLFSSKSIVDNILQYITTYYNFKLNFNFSLNNLIFKKMALSFGGIEPLT